MGKRLTTISAVAAVGLSFLGLAACSSSGYQNTVVDGSGMTFNSTHDLTQTSEVLFSGVIREHELISQVDSSGTPAPFAYAMVDVEVDEMLAKRSSFSSAKALRSGSAMGFAVVDSSEERIANRDELEQSYRSEHEVPKAGSRGLFFATYHDLGAAGNGLEIVGFVSSTDKKQAQFEPGVKGSLGGKSASYAEIVETARHDWSS